MCDSWGDTRSSRGKLTSRLVQDGSWVGEVISRSLAFYSAGVGCSGQPGGEVISRLPASYPARVGCLGLAHKWRRLGL